MSCNYKLNVSFTAAALNVINSANEKLAITKDVNGTKGDEVIWVATIPFEENAIEWEQDYMLYAARKEIQNGAKISKLSDVKAVDKVMYPFENAVFQSPQSNDRVNKNQYGVSNQMTQYDALTFGMAQSVTVNGEEKMGSPINAVKIPYNHSAIMSPIEKVKVFLGTNIDDGVVATQEFSNAIIVEFGPGETEKTIAYDYQKGMFIPIK